ncbi:hypothetical protein ABFS83_01G089600 [Erythranthe nasuta]
MSTEKLLEIDPQPLAFRLEVGRQASCRINISNNSQEDVAFKVMTTSPHKYGAQPNVGVLKPNSCFEITVIMNGAMEIPSDMECNDVFLIRSIVATPLHTPETAHELFDEGTSAFEDCRLTAVYVTPTRSERSAARSPQQWHGINGIDVVDWLKKGIAVVLLCLIVWLLVIKILPLIWSLTFMMALLMVKLGKKLLSERADDWMMTILLSIGGHIYSTVFRRGGS